MFVSQRMVERLAHHERSNKEILSLKAVWPGWLSAIALMALTLITHQAVMALIGAIVFVATGVVSCVLFERVGRFLRDQEHTDVPRAEQARCEAQSRTMWLTASPAALDFVALAECGTFKQPAPGHTVSAEEKRVEYAVSRVRPDILDRIDERRRGYEMSPNCFVQDYVKRTTIEGLAVAAKAWLADQQQQRMQQYHADGLVDPTAVTGEQGEIIDDYRRSVALLVERLADAHVSPAARTEAEAVLAQRARQCFNDLQSLDSRLTRAADHALRGVVEVMQPRLHNPNNL